MRSLNRITLIGNVGVDPECRDTGNGQRLAKFSLATNERWSGKSGQQEERTDWHRVTCWGKLAEFVEQAVRKGSPVYVEGSVRYEKQEKADGSATYWTEVIAREVIALDRASDRTALASPASGWGTPAPAPHGTSRTPSLGEPDDDLPF